MVDNNVKVIAHNNAEYAQCPTCSRMYPLTDDRGASMDAPMRCRRCNSPMDQDDAWVFGEDWAERERDPRISAMGRKVRGEAGEPPVRASVPPLHT